MTELQVALWLLTVAARELTRNQWKLCRPPWGLERPAWELSRTGRIAGGDRRELIVAVWKLTRNCLATARHPLELMRYVTELQVDGLETDARALEAGLFNELCH